MEWFSGIKLNWLLVIAGVYCLTVAGGASARQKSGPCSEDVAAYCKEVKQGEGRIARCLKDHANDLSPACREHAAEVKKIVQDFAIACKDDVTKLCKGTQSGGGRILHCLKQHEAELTPQCKEKMVKPQGR